MIVDTHVHVIADDATRYPLRPSGIGSEWFREHPVSAEQFAATATAATAALNTRPNRPRTAITSAPSMRF